MNTDQKFIIEEALKFDTPTRALIVRVLLESLDYDEQPAQSVELALLSESSLASNWLRPEEDEAWSNL